MSDEDPAREKRTKRTRGVRAETAKEKGRRRERQQN